MKTIILTVVIFCLLNANLCSSQPGKQTLLQWYQEFFQQIEQHESNFNDEYASLQLEQALEVADMVAATRAHTEYGLIELKRNRNYEASMDHFLEALRIEDSLSLKEYKIYTCIAIATVFEELGDYYKSANFLEQALQLNQSFNNTEVLVMIMNKQGRISAALGRMDEAFENYETVLKYVTELDKPAWEAEAKANLAELHMTKGEHDTALDLHKQALSIRRALDDAKGEAQSLNDIGELYRAMKNDEKAMANHEVALNIRRKLRDGSGIAESHNHIGSLLLAKKNYQDAVGNFQAALDAAKSVNAQNQMIRSLEHLSVCFQAVGDYKKALEYREQFAALNEMVLHETNAQRLLETQNRYVIQQRENQIDKLDNIRKLREAELREQEKINNLLYAIISLGVVIVLLGCYLYFMKQRSNKMLQVVNEKINKQNTELQELNATKDKFFSIISHDLKGPLNSLTSFSGLLINHTDSLSKDEIQLLAKDLDKSVKNLFALLENLLEWSRSQTGNIEFTPTVFSVTELLQINKDLLHAQAQNKKIQIEDKSQDVLFVNAHKHSVNTVIRNLLSNAIKFTPEGGRITLDARTENDHILVSVRDNGVGMPKEVMEKLFRIDTKHSTRGTADEKGTGLGLILCKDFIEKNGGKIWVESEPGKGSTFLFTIPSAKTKVAAQV
jgi:signal transduction histidine kinase